VVDEIDRQRIVDAECRHAFLTNFLKKTQELLVLDLTMQRQPDEVGIRMGEVGQRFALSDGLTKDKVRSYAALFSRSRAGRA
jgi:hypothetical protein